MSDYSSVPQKLKDLPNWVVWNLPSKVPFNPNNSKAGAKADDSSTWGTFAEACNTMALDGFSGIGFEFLGTHIAGIDFDNALDNGEIDPYVAEILLKLGNPYCEVSPSGHGLHAFVECTGALPKGQRKFSDGHHDGIEIYFGQEKGRYFTITGQKFSGDGIPTHPNLDVAYFMISQVHNEKIKSLWMGDLSDYGDDQSRADAALAWHLAQVVGKNADKIEQLISASKLGQREKWTDRDDYRQRTIDFALASKSEPTEAVVEAEPEILIRCASEIQPKRIKWLWDQRVPLGKITLFCGNPDNGKSLASTWLAGAISKQHDFPGNCKNTTPPSRVLMLVGEDDLDDTAVPRLHAAGADVSKIRFLEGVRIPGRKDNDEVRLDMDIPSIEKILTADKDIKLIVIDPISNYLGQTSMVSEQDARSILIPLKKIAAKFEVAIVIVMHLNKKSELEAISRVGGAMAFIGVSRASWLFIRDTEDDEEGEKTDKDDETFSMLRVKGNLTKAQKSGLKYRIKLNPVRIQEEAGPSSMMVPYIEWDETPVEMSADEALGHKVSRNHKNAGSDAKYKQALDFIRDELREGPLPSMQIFNDAKGQLLSPRTVERAAAELKSLKALKIYQSARKWIWELVDSEEVKSDEPDPTMSDDDNFQFDGEATPIQIG